MTDRSEYMRAYRALNAERIREHARQYYLDNKKKILTRNKRYKQTHVEEGKSWRVIYTERRREHNKQYYLDNRDKLLERSKKYQRKKRENQK